MSLKIEVRQFSKPEQQLESLEKALKIFKRKLEKDGILREVKERKYYSKPSEIQRLKEKEQRKNNRKKKE